MAKGQKRTDTTPKSANADAQKARKAAGPKYLRSAIAAIATATNLTAKDRKTRGSNKV